MMAGLILAVVLQRDRSHKDATRTNVPIRQQGDKSVEPDRTGTTNCPNRGFSTVPMIPLIPQKSPPFLYSALPIAVSDLDEKTLQAIPCVQTA